MGYLVVHMGYLRDIGKISIDLPIMYYPRKIKIILYYIIINAHMVIGCYRLPGSTHGKWLL